MPAASTTTGAQKWLSVRMDLSKGDLSVFLRLYGQVSGLPRVGGSMTHSYLTTRNPMYAGDGAGALDFGSAG